MANNIKSVLLVCTGNSCRSVMAEALLKKYLKEAGKEIDVRSAGVSAMDGIGATKETLDLLKEEGVDYSAFRSKRLTAEMIRNSDLVLVMEPGHREEVLRLSPEAASKAHLVREYGKAKAEITGENRGVPDPISRPMEFYRYCLGILKNEMERIVKIL